MLRRGCLIIVVALALLIGGCVVRSSLTEAHLQRTVFPAVRAEAAAVHRLLGLEGARLSEVRIYPDPFCQLTGLPPNLLTVAARSTPDGTSQPNDVLDPIQHTLEAQGWEFDSMWEGNVLRVGWRGGYRVQLGTSRTGLPPAEPVVSEVQVEVRNQDRYQSGC